VLWAPSSFSARDAGSRVRIAYQLDRFAQRQAAEPMGLLYSLPKATTIDDDVCALSFRLPIV
jgi:hypothetical protein